MYGPAVAIARRARRQINDQISNNRIAKSLGVILSIDFEIYFRGMNATLDITQIEKLIEAGIHFPPKIRDEQVYNFPKGQTKYMGEAKDMVKLTLSGINTEVKRSPKKTKKISTSRPLEGPGGLNTVRAHQGSRLRWKWN